MADWYVSSTAFAAIAAFIPSHTYVIGDICKPTAPALKAQWVFRCTTAGTASTEPTWPTTNNSTITTGGATFTNVTGQSTYFWAAAAGDMPTLLGAVGAIRFAAGDRMFVSSDHSESQTGGNYGSASGAASYTGSQVLSVNRAGSTPPVAADLTAGATVSVTGSGAVALNIDGNFPVYHYGMNYIYTGSAAPGSIVINSAGNKSNYLDTCQLYLNTATTTARITNTNTASLILYNSTARFAATAQGFAANSASFAAFEVLWLNTPSAIAGATIPTTLFEPTTSALLSVTARGVDLSAITGTLTLGAQSGCKYLFDSSRIASGVTRYNAAGAVNTRDEVELVNCFDGTSFISERHVPAGDVTTEFTITLSGGATDNVGTYSHKMVSNTNIDAYANTLAGFWMDANYATTGSAKTATVEIISSGTLNNNDISLELEYLGTASSSLASFANSLPATVLTTASAVASSSATWNSSPATPQKQHLQVTFTPRTAGRVRARVRLGKASTTVYVDPRVVIT